MPKNTNAAHDESRNLFLARMSERARVALWPALESVPLRSGEVLFDRGQKNQYVYFPTSGIICLLVYVSSGKRAGVAHVGRDGLVGCAPSWPGEQWATRSIVQAHGHAYRARSTEVLALGETDEDFRQLTLRHAQALAAQYAQNATCARLHTVRQQLCRWVLMCADLSHPNNAGVTRAAMTKMLGAHGDAVGNAVASLQDSGVIAYARGTIEVMRRDVLESSACECYAVLLAARQRLQSGFGERVADHRQPNRAEIFFGVMDL